MIASLVSGDKLLHIVTPSIELPYLLFMSASHLIVLVLDRKHNIMPTVFSSFEYSIGGRLEKKGISLVNKATEHLPRQIRPQTRCIVSGSLEHLMFYILDEQLHPSLSTVQTPCHPQEQCNFFLSPLHIEE